MENAPCRQKTRRGPLVDILLEKHCKHTDPRGVRSKKGISPHRPAVLLPHRIVAGTGSYYNLSRVTVPSRTENPPRPHVPRRRPHLLGTLLSSLLVPLRLVQSVLCCCVRAGSLLVFHTQCCGGSTPRGGDVTWFAKMMMLRVRVFPAAAAEQQPQAGCVYDRKTTTDAAARAGREANGGQKQSS